MWGFREFRVHEGCRGLGSLGFIQGLGFRGLGPLGFRSLGVWGSGVWGLRDFERSYCRIWNGVCAGLYKGCILDFGVLSVFVGLDKCLHKVVEVVESVSGLVCVRDFSRCSEVFYDVAEAISQFDKGPQGPACTG